MKSINLIVVLAFTIVGCSERTNSRPAPGVTQAPGAPNVPSAPAPTDHKNQVDEVAAKEQAQKAKDLLNALGVEVEGKDFVVKTEPKTYQETKDLKMALDAYEKAALNVVDIVNAPQEKAVWQEIANSANAVSSKYGPGKVYFKEEEEINMHESYLGAYGIGFKTVDNVLQIGIDKAYTYEYGRSKHLEVINNYIAHVEKFLQKYLDGQSPIDLETKVVLEKKLALAKELAATLN